VVAFIKSQGNFIFHVLNASKVKRRQAIRHLGVGFSSALVGTSWLSSCKKDDPGPEVQYDGNIIVIGAGPSGLYAADILMTKGLDVTVLEASDQIGGRVSSLRNQQDLPYQSIADFPVELGAEYWQGEDSAFGKIIGNLGLNTVELTDESRRYIIGNVVKSAADWGSNGDLAAVQAFMNSIKSYSGSTTSMKDAAGVSEAAAALLNSRAGNFFGSSSDRVGVKGISEQMKLVSHDLKYHVLKNNAMQDLMISRFVNVFPKIQLKSPVKAINYSSDPVKITLEDGTELTANKVVITVPVTILKNGITFTPALPSTKTAALSRIGMDPSMRVILDFKKNFWGTDTSFLWGGTTGPQYLNAGLNRSEFSQTMSVTINGPKALELSNLGSEELIVKALLAELDKLYDNQATLFVRKNLPPDDDKMVYFIKDWTKEKYIQGGFSYPMIATTLDDRTALMQPVNDRIFIGGEATDISGEAGTVSGALTSAERVADDVVFSIKKVS
jgi:monoamine oxidase